MSVHVGLLRMQGTAAAAAATSVHRLLQRPKYFNGPLLHVCGKRNTRSIQSKKSRHDTTLHTADETIHDRRAYTSTSTARCALAHMRSCNLHTMVKESCCGCVTERSSVSRKSGLTLQQRLKLKHDNCRKSESCRWRIRIRCECIRDTCASRIAK